MDRKGKWSLSPAFDVTYSFNPSGDWTSTHQMTLNSKRDGFDMGDFESLGRLARLKQREAKAMVDEVQAVVSKWRDYADEIGVPPGQRDKIYGVLRLDKF